jgi:WD40 repeat protein
MGNCFVSHQKSLRDERYIGVGRYDNNDDDENDKELRDPFSTEKVMDPTENETFSSDVTAPLSPDSTAFSFSPASHDKSMLSLTPLESPKSALALGFNSNNTPLAVLSPESEADDMVSPLSSEVADYSRSLVPAVSPHRKGRALQARLQKARHMQMALLSPTPSDILAAAASSSSLSSIHQRHSWERSDQSNSSRSLGAASSITSDRSMSADEQHQQQQLESLDWSVNAPWEELELDSPVLCTALSRTTIVGISPHNPPLFLAVGTETGTILIHELLKPIEHSGDSSETSGYKIPGMTRGGGRNGKNGSDIPKLGPGVSVKIKGRIRSMDFSPDGRYLAAGGDDCMCHIYQLSYESISDEDKALSEGHVTLHEVSELERVDRVYTVQFSPDNRFLAVGGFDGTVAIVATAEISSETPLEAVAEIPREGLILAVDWSPDSRFLAIGGSDRYCALVDCQQSWNVFREIKRSTTVQALKWNPTGKHLAIGSTDTVSIVLGRDSFAVVNEINIGKNRLKRDNSIYKNNAICWSPMGTYFVITGPDCILYETKKFTVALHIPRPGNATSVVWGQQGTGAGAEGMLPHRFLIIGGEDRKVHILKAGLEGHVSGGASTGGDDLSSAAGSSYMSTRGDWILKDHEFRDVDDEIDSSVDGNTNVLVENNDATVLTVAFSKGSKARPSVYFAHSTDNGLVTIRYCAGWTVLAEIQFPKPVETMSFSNGSRFLALGCCDSNVYVSDTISNWELVAKIEFAAPISSVQFGSKNNERLVVGSVDGTVAFLDPRKGYDFVGELEASDVPVVSIDWSSRNLAVGRTDGTVAIYDSQPVLLDSYVAIANLERDSAVCSVSFGVSSRFLAVGDAAGLVGIYSSKGGWVLCHQIEMNYCIASILWCPLGRHLAYSDDHGTLKVIDTIFWADVAEAESNSTPTTNGYVVRSSLAFSQDGRLLAFSRSDRGLCVMDSSTKWTLALNMLAEPLTELDSDHETNRTTASSSLEGSVGKQSESLYEV